MNRICYRIKKSYDQN